MEYKYNLQRQPPDERDLKLMAAPPVRLPRRADLRDRCPPVFDQGQLGSCTAQAGVAAYMMLTDTQVMMSRLYLYYMERYLEGTIAKDAGATMRTIGKALSQYGICHERLWPYDISKYRIDPPDIADADAKDRWGVIYRSPNGVRQIKQMLADGTPVMIGLSIYDSFESAETSRTGVVQMPDTDKEKLLGGHAVLIVGYDDDFSLQARSGCLFSFFNKINTAELGGHFIVRNSWGEGWGDEGYFYLPYEYVTHGLAFDPWYLEA